MGFGCENQKHPRRVSLRGLRHPERNLPAGGHPDKTAPGPAACAAVPGLRRADGLQPGAPAAGLRPVLRGRQGDLRALPRHAGDVFCLRGLPDGAPGGDPPLARCDLAADAPRQPAGAARALPADVRRRGGARRHRLALRQGGAGGRPARALPGRHPRHPGGRKVRRQGPQVCDPGARRGERRAAPPI